MLLFATFVGGENAFADAGRSGLFVGIVSIMVELFHLLFSSQCHYCWIGRGVTSFFFIFMKVWIHLIVYARNLEEKVILSLPLSQRHRKKAHQSSHLFSSHFYWEINLRHFKPLLKKRHSGFVNLSNLRISMNLNLRFSIGHLVWFSPISLPLAVELMLEYLGTSLSCQSGLIQTQFTHLHIVDTGDQQNRWFVRVQLHLTCNVLTIEVCIPPATVVWIVRIDVGTNEWNTKVSMNWGVWVNFRNVGSARLNFGCCKEKLKWWWDYCVKDWLHVEIYRSPWYFSALARSLPLSYVCDSLPSKRDRPSNDDGTHDDTPPTIRCHNSYWLHRAALNTSTLIDRTFAFQPAAAEHGWLQI